MKRILSLLMLIISIPLTSYSPRQKVVTVEQIKRDTVVLKNENERDYSKYSKDTLIDLGPLIKANKKLDKLYDIMKKDLESQDTIKKD